MTGEPLVNCQPYIGPRPFTRADARFFKGREQETAILEGLVLAKRVLLFFAQSGAGKSSLLEAGLIPRLTAQQRLGRGPRARIYQKMQVLPTLNVGGSFPPGTSLPQGNVFVYLALSALFPTANRAELEGYPDLSAGLGAYFAQQKIDEQNADLMGDILLIFDQFEELFSQFQQRRQDRTDFFQQVNAALANYPRLHVLFAMREDYIAQLEPYMNLLPENMRPRYRLERLDKTAALQAVVEPSRLCGREFAPGVAEELVNNLGRVQLGRELGHEKALLAAQVRLAVEPVHLQIVCQQLWERLSPQKQVIEADDLLKFGDVDEALADFYNRKIGDVVRDTRVNERHLRRWFDEELITEERTRNLFYHGNMKAAQINETAVEMLRDSFIIRRLRRGLDDWYELAHDRMVNPVLAANRNWNKAYLLRNPLAAAFAASLNDPSFVLRGQQLEKAKQFAVEHENDGEILPEEQRFLEESVAAQKARQRRQRLLVAGVALVLLFGLAMGLLAWWAIENAQQARSRELAAAAISSLETDPELGILLALQALQIEQTAEAENALRQALQRSRITRRLTPAGGPLRAVRISPDGRRLAAGGEDGRLLIWDLQAGETTAPLILPQDQEEGTGQSIYALSFHPQDSTQLATAHEDGWLRIWDLAQGTLLEAYDHGPAALFSLAYTADGSQLLSASPLQHSVCCSPDGQRYNHPFVFDLAASPDGRWLATAGRETTAAGEENGSVKLWDLQRQLRIPLPSHSLADHTDGVWAVAFSPDGAYLASGGEDKTVILYDISGLAAGQPPRILQTHFDHSNTIADLAFSANGRCLISASLDRTSKVWDIKTGQLLITLTGHTDRLQSVAPGSAWRAETEEMPPAALCGEQIATTGDDGTVRLWHAGATAEKMTLLEHHEPLESVDFNSSAQQLVSAGDDGRALVWDVDSGALLYELADPALGDQAHAARINRAIFSPDDTLIATASWDKTAKLWDLASRDALVLRGHDDRVENVAFNADGSLLATASDDGTARIWSTADGACLISLRHSSEANNEDVRKVYGVRFHPREPYLITTGGDGAVRGWLIAAEQLQRAGGCDEAQGQVAAADLEFAPDEQCQANSANCTVHDVAFNAAGTRLATVAWNSQVILRDFPAGSNQQAFTGHTRRLYGVQFSPDGANLATSGADGTVRIWDLETGQAQQVLPGPEFNFLDYSDDGQVLAAAGEDGTARLYALQLAELVDLAQGRLTRQKLTPAECARYALQDSALCR